MLTQTRKLKGLHHTMLPSGTQPSLFGPKPNKKLPASIVDTLCEDDSEQAQLLKQRQEDEDAANIQPSQKKEQLEILHACIDQKLAAQKGLLDYLLNVKKYGCLYGPV